MSESPRQITGFADHQSEQDFKHLAETLPQMVWTTTADGTLDYFSPQWGEFSGLSPDDPNYLNWYIRVHPDDAEDVAEAWAAAVEKNEIYERDIRFLAADGNYYWIKARAVPVLNEEGQIRRWYGTCSNIQEQKEIEEKLKKTGEEKDRFLAMLAHELRNPLAALTAGNELLQSDLGEAERAQVMRHHSRQLNQLQRLVEDTLVISRLSHGQMKVEHEEVDFVKVVQSSLYDLATVMKSKEIEVTFEREAGQVFVKGDQVRLSQCVTNIINNALKYTDEGGRVWVRLVDDHRHKILTLEVEDNGLGIAEENLGKIFGIFEQVDASVTHSRDGLGLGLSVVRSLIARHGGEVEAESEGLGKGSTFRITLPVIAAAEPLQLARDEDVRKGGPAEILLVEDNPSVALVMKLSLSAAGHQVRHASSGMEAFEALAEKTPDLIFCDLTLPGGMSGWDIAVKIIEGSEEGERPYLIALTGHTNPEHRERSLGVGFDEHLSKPASTKQIQETISRGLAWRAKMAL